MIYEVWSGKHKIGDINVDSRLEGKSATFYLPNGSFIEVPFQFICVDIDHCTAQIKRVLDVRRKSKRQIELLFQGYGELK